MAQIKINVDIDAKKAREELEKLKSEIKALGDSLSGASLSPQELQTFEELRKKFEEISAAAEKALSGIGEGIEKQTASAAESIAELKAAVEALEKRVEAAQKEIDELTDKKSEGLKNALEDAAQAADAVSNAMGEISDTAGDVSEATNETAEGMESATSAAGKLLEVLASVWNNIRNFPNAMKDLPGKIREARTETESAAKAAEALSEAERAQTAATQSADIAQKSAAVSAASWQAAMGWISVAITAVMAVAGAVRSYIAAQEAARDAAIETGKAISAEALKLQELLEKQKDFEETSDNYKKIEEQIVDLLGEKKSLLGDLTAGTKEYTERVRELAEAELAEATVAAIDARKAATEKAGSKFFTAYFDNYKTLRGEGLAVSDTAGLPQGTTVEEEYQIYKNAYERLTNLRQEYIKADAAGQVEEAKNLKKRIDALQSFVNAASGPLEAWKTANENYTALTQIAWEKSMEEISESMSRIPATARKSEAELKAIAEENGMTVDEVREQFNRLTEDLANAEPPTDPVDVAEYVTVLKSEADALSVVEAAQREYSETGVLTLETVKKLSKLSPEWVGALFDETGAVDLNSEAVRELIGEKQALIDASGYSLSATEAETEELKKAADALKSYSAQVDEVQTSLSILTAAQDEYTESGSLSIDTLQKLLSLGGEYINLIIDEEGKLRLDEDAVKDLLTAKNNLLDELVQEQIEQYATNRANYYIAQSTETAGNAAEKTAGQISILDASMRRLIGDEEGAARTLKDFTEWAHRFALSGGFFNEDWEKEWAADVAGFADAAIKARNLVQDTADAWKSTTKAARTETATAKKETDEYFESLKAAVSLRESELAILEGQGAADADRIAKIQQIQAALHDEAEYMRTIGAEQEEINRLSASWWTWNNKILSIQEKQAQAAEKAAKEAEEAAKKSAEEAKRAEEEARKTETAARRQEVADLKARLTLMEKQGKAVSERVEQMKNIQAALHREAEWLREIKAEQSAIDALSAEWWDWQEKILSLYKETLDAARELELEAQQKIIDAILNEIQLEEEALDISEKRLAVDEARARLEEAIAQAKIDYVQTVLSDYMTALSDAETLEEKQRAVAEARENLVAAQREAQSKALIEAFRAERDVKSDTLSLEEKRLEVERARQALADAENDRTTRVYNEASGQWEYQADARKVQSARDSLTAAIDALNAYTEEKAWEEVADAVERGSVSESELAEILERWAKAGYGNDTPEFVNRIQTAFRKAMGTAASPDSVAGQVAAVDSAVKNLNDYLKQEAVKELKEYIASGNTSAAGMQRILDRWLSLGEGAELYQWRDGLLDAVDGAIQSGAYDDSKVQSQVEAVENAVESLHNFLRSRFIREIEDIVKNGTAEEIRTAIEKWSNMYEISDTDRDWAERLAGAKGKYESTEAAWDEIMTNGQNSSVEQKRNVWQQMKDNSEAWWNATSQEEKDRLAAMNLALGSMMGWKRDEKSGIWYDEEGRRLFDKGGILTGTGGIKATNRPEIILDPDLTAQILKPGTNEQFERFAKSMNLMFETGSRTPDARYTINRTNSSVDSHNVTNVNGIPIREKDAEKYTIAELFRMMPLVK